MLTVEHPDQEFFELGGHKIAFTLAGEEVEGRGTVCLRLRPKPQIVVLVPESSLPFKFLSQHPMSFWYGLEEMQIQDVEVEGDFIGFLNHNAEECLAFRLKENRLEIPSDPQGVDEITFSLFDFPRLIPSSQSFCRDLRIENDEMSVSVLETAFTKEAAQSNRMDGISRRTHSVHVSFSSSKAVVECAKLIEVLQLFFSFVVGKECIAVCPVGKNSGGECWRIYSAPSHVSGFAESWSGSKPQFMAELFPSFSAMATCEIWGSTLADALHWYLNSNRPDLGADLGIILTQAALEAIAYNAIVNDRKLLSAKGFKDLRASDKIRLLARSFGIDCVIPESAEEIHAVIKAKNSINWEDLPHALTEIRNCLAHPDKKNRHLIEATYSEAWKLGCLILELAILRVCNYTGRYRSRLRKRAPVVEYTPVPWAGG